MKLYSILLPTLLLGLPTFADELNALTEAEKKDGWVLLFNGKTFDGWNHWKSKAPLTEGVWKIQDGALALTGKGGGDIYTAESYENFELSLEWKSTGNSGIMIRIDSSLKGPIWRVAPEMQILNKAGNGKKDVAGLYDLYAVEGELKFHQDDWNHVRIRVEGNTCTHWFNGEKVYSYVIGSDDWKNRVANSKWKKSAGYAETTKGHIGLQDHGNPVSFRNLKIKALK